MSRLGTDGGMLALPALRSGRASVSGVGVDKACPATPTRATASYSAWRSLKIMTDAPPRETLRPGNSARPGQETRWASAADRDRAAAVLGKALARGRLTITEHAQRLDGVAAATTVDQLARICGSIGASQ